MRGCAYPGTTETTPRPYFMPFIHPSARNGCSRNFAFGGVIGSSQRTLRGREYNTLRRGVYPPWSWTYRPGPQRAMAPSPLQGHSAQDLLQLYLLSREPFTLSQGRFLRSF
jgi:hypothetical protein